MAKKLTVKRSGSRDVAVTTKNIDKLKETRSLIRKVGKASGSLVKAKPIRIEKMLSEGKTDQALLAMQKSMLASVYRMLPIAEAKYRESPTQSYAYSLSSLIANARELAHDVRASSDQAQLATTLSRDIIEPAFRRIAKDMIDEHHAFRKTLEPHVDDKRWDRVDSNLTELARTLARKIASEYNDIFEKMNEYLAK